MRWGTFVAPGYIRVPPFVILDTTLEPVPGRSAVGTYDHTVGTSLTSEGLAAVAAGVAEGAPRGAVQGRLITHAVTVKDPEGTLLERLGIAITGIVACPRCGAVTVAGELGCVATQTSVTPPTHAELQTQLKSQQDQDVPLSDEHLEAVMRGDVAVAGAWVYETITNTRNEGL